MRLFLLVRLTLLFLSFKPSNSAPKLYNDNQTIEGAFPQLIGLNRKAGNRLPLALGGQDFDHCCRLAVNESLDIVDNRLVLRNITHSIIFDTDLDTFRGRQFPCGAKYIGEREGAPLVQVSYRYCKENCNGWQISKSSEINQWVSPLIGFLIPAVIFSLAIPRRRKVNLPESLFDVELGEVGSLPRTLYLVPAAAVLATIDTVQWLMTVFALAGPILLSGIYEAILDSRILAYVDANIRFGRLSTAQRAHLLYLVLVGNIDMFAVPDCEIANGTAWDDIDGPEGLISDLRRKISEHRKDANPKDQARGLADVSPLPEAPAGSPALLAVPNDINSGSVKEGIHTDRLSDSTSVGLGSDVHVQLDAGALQVAGTQLRAMLAAQYSFGVTVGAPVVFFCGSFIYTLLENYNNLGDNNVSHALAFGMWWMTIPHIAIISSFLLAGNNPNSLEGVVGLPTVKVPKLKWGFLTMTYESRYQPVSIWNRGLSKRLWAQRLSTHATRAPENLELEICMSNGDWIFVASMAYGLILIPSLLAFLTSFYTPLVTLSCRSMTLLIYMLCQLWLMALWAWDIESSHFDQGTSSLIRFSGRPWLRHLWNVQVTLNVIVATFTAIGGTMMQIIGVYRNCRCYIPISRWRNPDDVMIPISTNTKDKIYYASHMWTGTGSGAIAFLGFVTFVGWWYQKRLRYQFKKIIKKMGDQAEDHLELVQQQE